MKKCKECGLEKKQNEFYGVQGECKICTKKRIKISSHNIQRKCLECNKNFGTCMSEINRDSGKYCSRECFYKGNSGKNTYNWKGDVVSNSGLHKWIERNLGTPKYCEYCKTTKAKVYHWSNISGKYKRNVTDFQRLCVKCHSKYDIEKRKTIIIKCLMCNKQIKTKSKKRRFCNKNCNQNYRRRTVNF